MCYKNNNALCKQCSSSYTAGKSSTHISLCLSDSSSTTLTFWKRHVICYNHHVTDAFASPSQLVFTRTEGAIKPIGPLGWKHLLYPLDCRNSKATQKSLDILKAPLMMPYHYWLSNSFGSHIFEYLFTRKKANT